MNKQAYRVIFSQVVGTFIAVAENVSGQGKANSKSISTQSTSASKNRSLRFSTLSVAVAALFGSVTVAHAQMVAYKNGAGPRPIIDQSANGRPVVQIVTPNATGLSHNRYDQFNVDKNGAILNNSPTITQTQLGGYIEGNPNIAPGATAKIILNEVMSTNRSLLNGFIEVAGQRADVIIANPNGISVGGLGFINTSRAVLTTGTPTFGGDGSLAAFRVTQGDINVGAGGLNGTGTSALDLIARSVSVNDKIFADKLNVVVGANQVNYGDLGVTMIAGAGGQPTVGIDSSLLGGMYAQKIMLAGNEYGVGVRLLGDVAASAGDVTISNTGKITMNNKTNATGRIAIQSSDAIDNAGVLYAQQVALNSAAQVNNTGTIAAQNDVNINSASIYSTGVLGAGIDANGQATQAGNLTLNSSGLITTTGQNIAGSNIAFTGSGISFTDGTAGTNASANTSANTSANGAVTLTASAGDINHAGATLAANGGTTLTATGNIINDAGMINAGQLALRSAALSNVGGTLMQSGTGTTQITTTGKWDNTGGKLISNGQYLQVQTGSLTNAGGNISHAGSGALTITTGELDNTDGNIEALAGLNITADDLINTAGTLQNLGAYALHLQVNRRLSNNKKNNVDGFIGSASDILINAGEIDNREGTIYSKKNLLLQSDGTLINQSGVIQGNGIVSAVAGGVINNQSGRIEANGNGADPAAETRTETLRISGSSINNTSGRIANSSTGSTLIQSASSITNDAGVIGGNGDVTLTANTLNNTQQGQVIAAGNLNLQLAINLNNNQGSLYAAKNLLLQQQNATVSNQQGKISAAGKIAVDVAGLDNTLGQIISSTASEVTKAENTEAGDIALTVANQLNNSGGTIGSGQDLHLQAQTLTGDGLDGGIRTGRDAIVQLQGDHTFTANNMIRANRDFTFTTTGTLTNTADMEAVRHLTVNAGNITNLYGALMNAGNGTTFLKATNAVYNMGRIYGDDIAIEANTITNDGLLDNADKTLQAGVIVARNDVDLGASTIINREHAVIQSLRNMSIGGSLDANRRATGKAAYLQNASATLDAGADLNLQVARLDNLNLHFETRQERDEPHYVKYYLLDGSDTKYYDGIGAVIRRNGDVDQLHLISDGTVHNDFTIFYYRETSENTIVVRSDQGKIVAGGQIILSGEVNNDKSQILAGGAITGDLSGLINTEAKGQTITTRGGDGEWYNWIYDRWEPFSYSQYHSSDTGIDGRFDQYYPKVAISGSETLTPDLDVLAFKENQNLDPRNNDAIGAGVDQRDVSTGNGSTIGRNQDNPTLADDIQRGEQPLPNFTLPNSQLFPITTDPTAHYLVETDPKFTNYKLFLSSDYMLGRLGIDPQQQQKRLGDGYYEQKLINDQVAQLTGKRYLGDYTTNEQQYQALMESGVQMAEQFQLTPGIALTAAQMAALTSDMVWMVSQEVTLPDGSKTTVLAPVVYLARVDSAQMQPNGSIISGRSMELAVSGTVQNGGTLQGTNTTLIQATDIINTGTVRSDATKGNTVLVASNDIINTGGSIAGKSVGLLAGRDVVMSTTISENKSSTGNAQHGFSSENNIINNVASVTADQLSIQSGRDISLTATKVDVTGNGAGHATMVAGRDINLNTVTTKEAFSANYNAQNNLRVSKSTDVGTQISTGGNLVMSAGQDINAKAAYANATGEIVVAAGRDINLVSAQQQSNYAQEIYSSSSGLISSSSTHTKDNQQSKKAIGTTLSGDKVQVAAGRDINVTGSNVVGTNDVNVVAGNNINIIASQDTAHQSYRKQETTTGLFSSGSFGVTLGSKEEGSAAVTNQVINNASTIGSTNGNVTLAAGKGYTQSGSNVVAVTGDTTISAKTVDINAVQDSYAQTNTTHTEQSGLTLAVSAPIITAVQTIQKMSSAAKQTDDKRMQVLAGATAASAAYSAVSAAQSPTSGVTVSLTIGSSESESQSSQTSTRVAGSKVTAGGNVSIRATGAGENSNLNIIGSDITAGQNAILKADGDINLLAAQGSSDQQSSSSSSSFGVGIAATYGPNGVAAGIHVNAAASRGNADGSDVTNANTHIKAGNTLLVESGHDTNLIGAVASAQKVLANVGTSGSGNLNIQSLQDKSKYDSEDENIGGSFTYGYGASTSVNYGQSQANSDFASVNEQSGIKAGDGGFIINVNGNTNLTGGIIASTATPDKNILATQTLTQSDIQNHANASADSFDIGLSTDMLTQGAYGASKAIAAGLLSNSDDSGSSTGTTRSAVSAGTVIISDNQKQQELTGKHADVTIASLNRDTENAHIAAQQQDVLAMEQTVKANQTIKQAALAEATKFTDEAYRTMFIKKADIYVIKKDADGNPYKEKLSEEEKNNLQPGKDGKVRIANNGIFNDIDAAAKYADQHSTVGDGPQYLIHYPEADNGLSELLISGYQHFLEGDVLGNSNSVQETLDSMNQYGKDGLHLDGHSRGSITIGNALESLQNKPDSQGSLSGTTINLYGPAYNAEKADAILSNLQNRDALMSTEDKNNSVLNFMNHSADFVGGWIGRNPDTGGSIPEGSNFVWEALRVLGGEDTVHNCYGNGGKECSVFWQDSPNSKPVLKPVRKY